MIGYCLCYYEAFLKCIEDGFVLMCQFTNIILHESKTGIVHFSLSREKTTSTYKNTIGLMKHT